MFNGYVLTTTVHPGRGSPRPVDWGAFCQALRESVGDRYDPMIKQVLLGAAEEAKRTLIEWGESGRMMPPKKDLAAGTRARKTALGYSGYWLYETGEMLNSLEPQIIRLEGAGLAAGLVLPGEKRPSHGGGKAGMNYARLVQMLIYGCTINVTDPVKVQRMIAYLKGLGILGEGETPQHAYEDSEGGITIYIPPRGELIPPEVKNAVSQRVRRYLMNYLRERVRVAMEVIGREHWDATLPVKVRFATRSVKPPEYRA